MSDWDDLQAAYILANRHISAGRDPDTAAVEALWQHCRHAVCAGIGHPGRPERRLQRWADKVWTCPRCGTQFITHLAYAGYGESAWRWALLEDVRA